MKINREGFRIIATTALVCAAVCVGVWMWGSAAAGWCVTVAAALWVLGTAAFFRDPRRPLQSNENAVYAPCDGKVVIVERARVAEYFGGRECLQVSVFMSITNVHVNLYPVAGTVTYYKYHPGKFLVAWLPKASELNEHTTTVVSTGHGEVMVRQIAGFVARRIVCYARQGAAAQQNGRLGFIKFGSRMDLFLPLDAQPTVKVGDCVAGGQTILAKF